MGWTATASGPDWRSTSRAASIHESRLRRELAVGTPRTLAYPAGPYLGVRRADVGEVGRDAGRTGAHADHSWRAPVAGHHRPAGSRQVDSGRGADGRTRSAGGAGAHGRLPPRRDAAAPPRPARPQGRTRHLRLRRLSGPAAPAARPYRRRRLRSGVPPRDREPIAGAIAIPRSTPLVITEGNYLLHWKDVRALLHEV